MSTNTPEDWVEEARRRLNDAQVLFDRARFARVVSAVYFACNAAAHAALCIVNVHPKTYDGLKNRLGYHFVRSGRLSTRATRDLDQLQQRREKADYLLTEFAEQDARSALANGRQYVEEIESLIGSDSN